MAFKIAGSMPFKEAARKASPVILEPVMSVEVVTPEDFAGTIMGDLSSRRGRIEGMEHRAGFAGDQVDFMAFDGSNIWVTNGADNTVTKLRASSGALLGTYPVGLRPDMVAFDGSNVWVTNDGGGVTRIGATK